MESITKQIEKQLNIIVDRWLKLDVSFKSVQKYLTGNNIKTVIDELAELESTYLKRNKDKSAKDFKNMVKDMIISIIKDRRHAYMDKNENMKHIKLYENFEEGWDDDNDNEHENHQVIICDEYIKEDVEQRFPNSVIYPRSSVSSIISTIKTLQSKGVEFSVILYDENLDEETLIDIKEITFHHRNPYDILIW